MPQLYSYNHELYQCVARNTTTSKRLLIRPMRLANQPYQDKRIQYGNAVSHKHADATSLYRVAYYGIIDQVMGEVNRRFQQPSYKILASIESTILEAANGKFSVLNQITDLMKNICSADVYFSKLESELLLSGFIRQSLPDVKEVRSVYTVVSVFEQDSTAGVILANVKSLLQIYLIAPMSVAAGERTFSVYRRLKSYLRTTMTERRYNNMLVLHIHKEQMPLI